MMLTKTIKNKKKNSSGIMFDINQIMFLNYEMGCKQKNEKEIPILLSKIEKH